MNKMLIVHTWGLGDWLFFTPVLKSIIGEYPGIQIDILLGTPSTRQLVDIYPEVRVVGVSDVRKSPLGMVKLALMRFYKKYDCLLFTAGIDGKKADMLSLLIRSKIKAALVQNTISSHSNLNRTAVYDDTIHAVDNNLKLAGLIGIDISKHDTSPYIPMITTSVTVNGSVLIHPGCDSRNLFKRWPIYRFIEVAHSLLNNGRQVGVILGPAERDLSNFFVSLESCPLFKLYQSISFGDLLQVIPQYETFLSSDSGLGHIAAALQRKTVTILGPADPVKVRPYHSNGVIIRSPLELPCMPCFRKDGRKGCSESTCLDSISVEKVLEYV